MTSLLDLIWTIQLRDHVAQSRSGVVHGNSRGWPDRPLVRTGQ
jgi:hypothetical protein